MRPARYVLLLLNCGLIFAQSYVISTYAGRSSIGNARSWRKLFISFVSTA